jgi:DNA-binding NtrC family response regulator
MKKGKVVLVIDDDVDFLQEIHALLCEKNYTVISCADAGQALSLTWNCVPDKIILDLAMPHVRGEDLMRVIRKRHPHIPIVVCTGVPNAEVSNLLEGGAVEVFQKPFSSEALFRTLEAAA